MRTDVRLQIVDPLMKEVGMFSVQHTDFQHILYGLLKINYKQDVCICNINIIYLSVRCVYVYFYDIFLYRRFKIIN